MEMVAADDETVDRAAVDQVDSEEQRARRKKKKKKNKLVDCFMASLSKVARGFVFMISCSIPLRPWATSRAVCFRA